MTGDIMGKSAHPSIKLSACPAKAGSERISNWTTTQGLSTWRATALRGYGLLKLTSRSEGLEPLRQQLGERFAKTPLQPQPVPDASSQLARAA